MDLLESLCNQSFHDFEVIIVDDSDRSRRKETESRKCRNRIDKSALAVLSENPNYSFTSLLVFISRAPDQ